MFPAENDLLVTAEFPDCLCYVAWINFLSHIHVLDRRVFIL